MQRIKNELALVKEFQETFNRQQLTVDALIKLCVSLTVEEVNELLESYVYKDKLEELDALIDIKYVAYGALIKFNSTYHEPYFLGNSIEEMVILLKGYAWDSDTQGMCNMFCEIIKWADKQLEEMFVNDPTSIYSAFTDVHKNNMAKLHTSVDHCQQTIAKLGDEGYKINAIGEKYWALVRISDNKIIKPFDHEKVSLKNYIICLE
jgi:predicted HAD superfamily Cof-like phosphohydrolase